MPCGVNKTSDWSQCVGHRTPCPANRPYGGGYATAGTRITAALVESLRAVVAAEIAGAWKLHRFYSSAPVYTLPVGVSGRAEAGVANAIDQMIHLNGTVPHAVAIGTIIDESHFNTLVNEYNNLRVNCICNTDCGCNQVCVCNIDCGCNYSDNRLKQEIQYC